MKQYTPCSLLCIVTFLFGFCLIQENYQFKYKTNKCILVYSFVVKNDSVFLLGELRDKKSDHPVVNINVSLKDYPIGTVPESDGKIKLFLVRSSGVILFDKAGYTKFVFPYTYSEKDLRREESSRPRSHQ